MNGEPDMGGWLLRQFNLIEDEVLGIRDCFQPKAVVHYEALVNAQSELIDLACERAGRGRLLSRTLDRVADARVRAGELQGDLHAVVVR